MAQSLTAPTGLSPNGTLVCGTTSVTFRWNAVSGATSYALRIDDQSNGWTGNCFAAVNPGDTCDQIANTYYARSIVADGRNYDWWVHACNSSGCSAASSAITNSSPCVASTPTPTPYCTDTDGGLNYYVKGHISGTGLGCNAAGWDDLCATATILNEAHCGSQNQCLDDAYTCPDGCSNGSCLIATTKTLATPTRTPTRTPTPGPCSKPPDPSGLSPSGTISAGSRSLTWNAVSGATQYWVRLDDKSNGWTGSCTNLNPGDACYTSTGTSAGPYNFQAGRNYSWWVQSVNSCGYSSGTPVSVSVSSTSPTGTPTPGGNCPNGTLGNINCDSGGLINESDLSILLSKWYTGGCPAPAPGTGQRSADLNGDCRVDETDLSTLLRNWRT